jgi:hypothetical protein
MISRILSGKNYHSKEIAEIIAELRQSEEAKEGIKEFFDERTKTPDDKD